MSDDVGWVAQDKARAIRTEHGRTYGLYDWPDYIERKGWRVVEVPAAKWDAWNCGTSACLVQTTIFLRAGMRPAIKASRIWHEIGEKEINAGSLDYWDKRPLGKCIVAKMERRARELAKLLPG